MRASIAALLVCAPLANACDSPHRAHPSGQVMGTDAGTDAGIIETRPDASFAGALDASPTADAEPSLPEEALVYPSFAALHEKAIATTCALNGGVCHNSKEYPDLHTAGTWLELVGRPCNVTAAKHADVHDACEMEGDHLVVASKSIDVEIARMVVIAADYDVTEYRTATIHLAAPVDLFPGDARDVEIDRQGARFRFESAGVTLRGAPSTTTLSSTTTLYLDMTGTTAEARAARYFFNDTHYPWNEHMIRVADVNANGVLGHRLGISLLEPGAPLRSFVLLRLLDTSQGELMPLQCRAWDDRATRALGCWIEGLVVDANGAVTNADAPIDYARCGFVASYRAGSGRCAPNPTSVDDIFGASCGGSSCHIGEASPAAGLDLSRGKARGALVDRASTESAMRLVVPGDPDDSYLMCKLSDGCTTIVGSRMPKDLPALGADRIETLRAWIRAGAPAP